MLEVDHACVVCLFVCLVLGTGVFVQFKLYLPLLSIYFIGKD